MGLRRRLAKDDSSGGKRKRVTGGASHVSLACAHLPRWRARSLKENCLAASTEPCFAEAPLLAFRSLARSRGKGLRGSPAAWRQRGGRLLSAFVVCLRIFLFVCLLLLLELQYWDWALGDVWLVQGLRRHLRNKGVFVFHYFPSGAGSAGNTFFLARFLFVWAQPSPQLPSRLRPPLFRSVIFKTGSNAPVRAYGGRVPLSLV